MLGVIYWLSETLYIFKIEILILKVGNHMILVIYVT